MAKFLLVWELGGALGHLATLRAVATPLTERGHQVTLALRSLGNAPQFFPDLPCHLAPTHQSSEPPAIADPSTFADVLYICGWSDPTTLGELVDQWHTLFREIEPDVVIANYAPTAVLALQGQSPRIVLLGTGFCTPPNIAPLPDLCPWRDNYPERLLRTERQVLAALNAQLASQGEPPVEHVTELFTRVDANLLTTVPEMDHYLSRTAGEYVGPCGELAGAAPDWPARAGPRVFAYLKPMEALAYLLDELQRRQLPTLVYAPHAEDVAKPFASEHLYVVDAPLDMPRVSRECDLAILNAGHNGTLRILLGGKPVLAVPLSGEQHLVAQNVERLGAGLCVPPNHPRTSVAVLNRILTTRDFATAAQRFANRYAGADWSSKALADRIEQVLG